MVRHDQVMSLQHPYCLVLGVKVCELFGMDLEVSV